MLLHVMPLRLRLSNAYLVRGERAILVDSGSPGEEAVILAALARAGVAPRDLALILHTHGHSDHLGSTAALAAATGAPVALHPGDVDMATRGRNRTLHPTSLEARVVRPFVDGPFDPVTPSLVLEAETDLRPFGIAGRAIATPGHTAGSVSILLDNGDAIIGDLLMGGWMGGHLRATYPNRHYFVEDAAQLVPSLRRVLAMQPARLWVGHGGPLDPAQVVARFVPDARVESLHTGA